MIKYIPKIMITQQPGTDRLGYENENGELQLFIEKDMSTPEIATEQKSEGNLDS